MTSLRSQISIFSSKIAKKISAIFEIVFANLIEKRLSDRRHSFLEFGAKSGKKSIKNSQKNAKFDEENEKNRKFNYSIAKCFWRFLTKKLRLENGAKQKEKQETSKISGK